MNTALPLPKAILTMTSPPSTLTPCRCGARLIVAVHDDVSAHYRMKVVACAAYVLKWVCVDATWVCPACWEGDTRSQYDKDRKGVLVPWAADRAHALSAWRAGR